MIDGVVFQKLTFSQIIEYVELSKNFINVTKHVDAFRAEGFDEEFRTEMLNFLSDVDNLSTIDSLKKLKTINDALRNKKSPLSFCYASLLKQILLCSVRLEEILASNKEVKEAHDAFIKNINKLIKEKVKITVPQSGSSLGSFSRAQKAGVYQVIESEKLLDEFLSLMNVFIDHKFYDFAYITHEFICLLYKASQNTDSEDFADGLILESVLIKWFHLEDRFTALKKKFPEGDKVQQHYFLQYMCSCMINHPVFTKSIGYRKDTYQDEITKLYRPFRYGLAKNARKNTGTMVPLFDMSRLNLEDVASGSSSHSYEVPNTPRGERPSPIVRQPSGLRLRQWVGHRVSAGLTPRDSGQSPRSESSTPRKRSGSSPRKSPY